MNWTNKPDSGQQAAGPSRQETDRERTPSDRLASRQGRRPGSRPPVDPDLERFLTSADAEAFNSDPIETRNPFAASGMPSSSSSKQLSEEDGLEVIIPDEIVDETALPRWRKLNEPEPDRRPQPSKSVQASPAPTHELVHVPKADPLFPGSFPMADREATDTEKSVRILFRRFPLFLLVAIVIWSAFALYLTIVPPTYEAETTLLVDIEAFQSELNDLPRLSGAGTGFGGGKLANQTLILQTSPELAQRAAAELAAIRAENPNRARWTIFNRLTEEARRGGSLASLLSKDYVTVQGRSSDEDEPDAITISSTSTDPAEAALIANVYSQTYVSEVDRLVTGHFSEALAYYELRREDKQADLDQVTEEMKQYIRTVGAYSGQSESDHLLNQIAALNASLDDTSIEIEELKASISSLETEVELMDGQLVAERAAHGIEDQLDQNYERIAELNIEIEKFYVKNPELRLDSSPSQDLTDFVTERRILQNQADSLSQMYSSEITAVGGVDLRSYDGGISYMASLRRDLIKSRVMLDAAKAKQQATLVRLADYETRRRAMPEQAIEYREISSRHTSAIDHITDLNEKIQNIEEAADGRKAFVRVLNPAIEPTSPKVHPMMIAFLGGILGLLAGIGAAFMSDKTDSRLYEKSDIERLDVDVIATVPRFTNISRRSRRVFYERKISSEVLSVLQPEAPASRALRSIPLRIAGNTLNHSLFVFTGVDPKAGTSFLAVNTAAALARSGARVLLVDANMTQPSVIQMLGLTDQARFDMSTNSFAEGRGIEAFSGRLPHLYAMALEAPKGENPEYLLSANLGSFIQRVRKQFDAVVVDTPSLSRSTTALGLSRMADEMIVAVRTGMTNQTRLTEALEDIRSAAGSRARVVLNGTGKAKVPAPASRQTA